MQWIQMKTTFSRRDAAMSLSERLVRDRLVACVQVDGPIESVYRWEGKIEKAVEWRLSMKTHRDLFQRVAILIQEEHGYDVPELVATELVMVAEPYAKWLAGQLSTE